MPGKPKQETPKKTAAKAMSKTGYGLGLANKPMELELPSGNMCLAIRPGAQGLIKAGLLDSLDQLTSMVQVEHIDSKDPKKALQEGVAAMSADPKKILEGLEIIDKAVAFVVREPRVFLDEPELDDDGNPVMRALVGADGRAAGEKPVMKPRDPARLYADEVDLDDKMFIFQWAVGGTSDLVQFRKESAELMGSISASKDV